MLRQIRRKLPKRGIQPKADGNPRGIWCQAQDIKAGVGRQIGRDFLQGAAFGDLLQNTEYFLALLLVIGRCHDVGKKIFGCCGGFAVGGFRPKHRAGIADGETVAVFAAQQIVQRGGIGKGRHFRHRRIRPLLFAKRSKGFFVKRNNRAARTLTAEHALNRRMQPRNRRFFATNQTQALLGFITFQTACPQCLRRFSLVNQGGRLIQSEHHIGIRRFRQARVIGKLRRLPVLQKAVERLQALVLFVLQHIQMVLPERLEGFFRRHHRFGFRLRLIFIGFHAQGISGFVPQKIRLDTRRALFRARHAHQFRLRLFIRR